MLSLKQQVRAFLQLGKNSGKESIGVAVDVATDLMMKMSVTPKFTLEELRDNISQQKCGMRGQSRRFHKLDRNFQWTGVVVSAKVPVIHLKVFPQDVQHALIKSKCMKATLLLFLPPSTLPHNHSNIFALAFTGVKPNYSQLCHDNEEGLEVEDPITFPSEGQPVPSPGDSVGNAEAFLSTKDPSHLEVNIAQSGHGQSKGKKRKRIYNPVDSKIRKLFKK